MPATGPAFFARSSETHAIPEDSWGIQYVARAVRNAGTETALRKPEYERRVQPEVRSAACINGACCERVVVHSNIGPKRQ
jgi:hypothetical protein